MDIQSVCILGGSGFVGASIADQACARGYRVRVVTRSAQRARHVLVLPTCEVMVADPHDNASLADALDNMDAVVNLVGVLHQSRGASFRAVHVELPRRLAMAAHTAGVRQILHMSALGASPSGPSAYLRSKAEGEKALQEMADVVPWTIFRPSVIFGEHDRFLNLFATLVRFFPVIPLGAAKARFQP